MQNCTQSMLVRDLQRRKRCKWHWLQHEVFKHAQVDGLLEGCKVHLTGSRAVDAVAIEHPGFALWPMADKESQESAELETTAAVLIPDHMLPESGGDEGSLC